MIVATLAEKGGVGKTTFAANLAGMRANCGRRVLVLDGDRQGAAHSWVQRRLATKLPAVACETRYGSSFSIYATTSLISRPYDDFLVDLGQGDSEEMDAALGVADVALVPVRPSALDMRTMGLIDVRVEEARVHNPSLRGLVVLNQVSPNPRHRSTQEAWEALNDGCVALEVSRSMVRDRVGFQRAYALGMTVHEHLAESDKCAIEMSSIYEQVFGEAFSPEPVKALSVVTARR